MEALGGLSGREQSLLTREKEPPATGRDARRRGECGDGERRDDKRPVAAADRAWSCERPATRIREPTAVHRDREPRRAADRGNQQRARHRKERGHSSVVEPARATREGDRLPFVGEERHEPK